MAHVLNNEKLTSLDDLFKSTLDVESTTGLQIREIPLEELYEFTNHPFRVEDDENMMLLSESIKDSGVHQPGIARIRPEGGYEIIEGHRRRRGCELAGLSSMPFQIVEWDDDTAKAYMALSNLTQRKEFKISEKARGYRTLRDSMEHRGKKGFITVSKIGENTGDSDSTIKRLIRIAYLTDPLIHLVDIKKLGLDQGKNISYLSEEEQKWIYEILEEKNFKLSINMDQAKELRDLSEKGKLTRNIAISILEPEKKEKKRSFTMKQDDIDNYFSPEYSDREIKEVIIGLLEDWKAVQARG